MSNREAPTKLQFALKCAHCVDFWSVFQGASQQKFIAVVQTLEVHLIGVAEIHVFALLVSLSHSERLFMCVPGGQIPWQSKGVWCSDSHLQYSLALKPGVYMRDYRIAYWLLCQKRSQENYMCWWILNSKRCFFSFIKLVLWLIRETSDLRFVRFFIVVLKVI